MMKGRDALVFYVVIALSFLVGILQVPHGQSSYSDLITFLSIMIGFEIASLSVLFNSSFYYIKGVHSLPHCFWHTVLFHKICNDLFDIFVHPTNY